MKTQKISAARIGRVLALLGLMFVACLVSARAQVRPFVDCVERIDGSNYRAYFGYSSLSANLVVIPVDGPRNFFTPILTTPGQPDTFYPGVHHRAVAVNVPNETNQTWFLGVGSATSSAQTFFPCNDAGNNTRTITYQGRLTDGAATANGQYDLRFQLYDATVGGTAQTVMLALENVAVTNGVFTAQLDFGIVPAILDGNNLFLEIAVRPGASTGAYTTLAPRQPLTTTPYAMRAQSAANADLLGGLTANQFIRNTATGFSPVITGDLTVTWNY